MLTIKHKITFFLCVGSRRLNGSDWTKGRAIFIGDARIRDGVDGSWVASTRSKGNYSYIYEDNLSQRKSRRGIPNTRPSSPPPHCPNISRHTTFIVVICLTVLAINSPLQNVFKRWRLFLEPLSQFIALRAIDRAKIVHLLHDATTKKVFTAG